MSFDPRTVVPLLGRIAAEGRTSLLEHEVYAVLAAAGLRVPAHRFLDWDAPLPAGLAETFDGDELVVKVVATDISHKSDIGGVRFCPRTSVGLEAAVAAVREAVASAAPEADVRGVLVAEKLMLRRSLGAELLASLRHDAAFGPVVFLGPGGLDTEALLAALEPAAAGVAATPSAVQDRPETLMEKSLVGKALRGGLRSSRGAAVASAELQRAIVGLADLASAFAGFTPEGGVGLAELEVNPLAVTEEGRLVAVDGLARLHTPDALPPARPVAHLRHLFEPQSAAVLGVSARKANVGRIILRNLAEGGGVPRERLYTLHDEATEIDGCRAFPSLDALPETVDLAVVAVPAHYGAARLVQSMVEKRSARALVLVSGGFGETEGGAADEAAMRAAVEASHAADDGGVVITGGNCLGVVSEPGRINTFFIPTYKLPFRDAPVENVALVSQSGAYLVTLVSSLEGAIRPRYTVSFGNQMDLTVTDYLAYLMDDPEVAVAGIYLEGFRRGDGERFLDVASRFVASGRRIVCYKAGRTAAGSQAAASHTAAAVGDYDVFARLVRAAGVDLADSLDEFDDLLRTFAFLAGRTAQGRDVGIVSNAGFECTVAADTLGALRLATFSPATAERVAGLLPDVVAARNPVDATPITTTDRYAGLVEAVLADDAVDAVVAAGVPITAALNTLAAGAGHGEDITREDSLPSLLVRAFHASRKPVVFSVDAGPRFDAMARQLQDGGLPVFRKVDRAVAALERFLRR